ncbi:hypothetical protein RYX36_004219 [Vicia faba]
MTGLTVHGCILDLYIYVFTDKASLFWFCYRKDVAIAYGFNAIKDQSIVDNKGLKRLAASLTLLPLNELSDLIRIYITKLELRRFPTLEAEFSVALLLFSGGVTGKDAGPRSEAQSYWAVADFKGWFGVFSWFGYQIEIE